VLTFLWKTNALSRRSRLVTIGKRHCPTRYRPTLEVLEERTLLSSIPAIAGPGINYDPYLPAPAPVLSGGWNSDEVNKGLPTGSVDSPYVYTLTAPATFSITDDFIPGDVYHVFDMGKPILVTTFSGAQTPFAPTGNPFDPAGNAAWSSASYSHGSVLLSVGLHSLTIEDDGSGAGNIYPAGFWDRLDPVPVHIKLDNLPLDGHFHIDASPKMPDIEAELTGIDPSVAASLLVTWVEQVSFFPSDDPTGNADSASANTIVDTKQTIGTQVTFTQNDVPGVIQGGRVTITATAIVDNQQLNTSLSKLPDNSTNIMIVGDNPTAVAVASYIQRLGTPTLAVGSQYDFGRLLEAIIKEESGGVTSPRAITNQFLSSGVPTFNMTGDGGVGLTQITPGVTPKVPRTNGDIWNWQTNLSDGFRLLSLDLTQAYNHFMNDLKTYGPKLPALAAQYGFESVTMEQPTTDELLLFAVGLYRKPVYYSQYNGESSHHLVPTADPNNPINGIVILSDGYNDYVATILGLYQ
jgi:hypothetical protein